MDDYVDGIEDSLVDSESLRMFQVAFYDVKFCLKVRLCLLEIVKNLEAKNK